VINVAQIVLAILLGNIVYFLLEPSLPAAAQHRFLHADLGILVDSWFCLVAYGLIRTARRWK
jgi:hypothetical protein